MNCIARGSAQRGGELLVIVSIPGDKRKPFALDHVETRSSQALDALWGLLDGVTRVWCPEVAA